MLSIDANVLVRCLVDEDPDNVAAPARLSPETKCLSPGPRCLKRNGCYAAFSDCDATLVALRDFLDLPTVAVEAFEAPPRALDFADALHLSGSPETDGFVSFDKKMLRAAIKLGIENVRQP